MQRAPVLLAILFLASSVSAEITSSDLKHCPDGHTTLKDVPIYYGARGSTDKEWKELKRRADNLEFVMAPDELPSEHPPHYRPTCTTCRFGFDSLTKTWSRNSPDARSFRRPFTRALQFLPIPKGRKDINYVQWVRDYRLVKESVSYVTAKDSAELRRAMQRWVRTFEPKATYKAKGSWGTSEWRFGDSFLEYSPEQGKVFVWLVRDVKRTGPNQAPD